MTHVVKLPLQTRYVRKRFVSPRYMRLILCALDLSEASLPVLEVAMEMANRCESHLTVLFSYRLIQEDAKSEIIELRKSVESRAKHEFELLETKLNGRKTPSYDFRMEIGFLSDRIESFNKKNPVDLVVIGQRLASTMSEHKGSTFQQFISSVKIPVLLVPENMNAHEFMR